MGILVVTVFRSQHHSPHRVILSRIPLSTSQTTNMPSLTGNSFDPDKDIPDLTGKDYIVTGGSAGIGFGIAAHLLQHNANSITILSNKEEHATSALEELKEYGDTNRVHWTKCDLEDLKFVDEVANKLAQSQKKIDGLILNAGLGVGVYNETKDRLDSHFQVNHLSQFHLMLKLLPNLRDTPNSRIVLESSELHRGSNADTKFENEAEINRDIGPTKLYNRTKLAQILTVRALQRRIDAGQLASNQVRESTSTPYPPAVSRRTSLCRQRRHMACSE